MPKAKLFLVIIILSIVGYFTFKAEEDLKGEKKIIDKTIVESSHKTAINKVKSSISSYYFMVAAVKAYTKTLKSPPTATQLQNYISDYTEKVGFQDSILLSFLDSNHKFIYTVGPSQLDPVGLSGFNISWFRTDKEIEFLDSVMQIETITLNQPINLVEKWPAFPFSFHLKYNNDIIYGYIAAVLNIEYLTNEVYDSSHDSRTFHRFIVNQDIDFTNVAVYDSTTIYNEHYDSLYYKNKNLIESDFIYSSYELFGHQFTIGTALLKTESDFEVMNFLFEFYLFLAITITLLTARITRTKTKQQTA